ncbi:MAG: tetratricopeptide repeat protein [Candidatus Polarisedimenticolia bacterium]
MKKASTKKSSAKTAPTGKTQNAWVIQEKALKEFERGITLMQKQNYAEARGHFQVILDNHQQERELVDRARIYARICAGLAEKREPQPRKPEDYFYFGVMKANDADYDAAVTWLQKALQATPKDEKVHYVLASTLALKGERRDALEHLRTAVELNATNRIHARNDPDFEPLRDDDNFQNLIHPEEA